MRAVRWSGESRGTPREVLAQRLAALEEYTPEHSEDAAGIAAARCRIRAALGLAGEHVAAGALLPMAPSAGEGAAASRQVQAVRPDALPRSSGGAAAPKAPRKIKVAVEVDGRTWPSFRALSDETGVHVTSLYAWRDDGSLSDRVRDWMAGGNVRRYASAQPIEVDGESWPSLVALAKAMGRHINSVTRWRDRGELADRVRAWRAGAAGALLLLAAPADAGPRDPNCVGDVIWVHEECAHKRPVADIPAVPLPASAVLLLAGLGGLAALAAVKVRR